MDERTPVWDEPDGSFYYGEQLKSAEVIAELDDLCAEENRVQRKIFRALLRCDLRRVWRDDDCDDLAHWVSHRMGISRWKARRFVACAWSLERHPLFCAAFEDGRLSVDKLVELTRLADAVEDDDETVLGWGLKESPASLRARADWARKIADEDARTADRQRSLTWWWSEDHSFMNLYGSLPTDMGIRVTNALDRLARKLPESPEDYVDPDDPLAARRADALDLLAGHAIAEDKDPDRATVVVHAPLSALTDARCNGTGPAGEPMPPEVMRLLSCDCRIQPVLHGEDGAIVGVGETSRLIPPWLRRAILRRDGFRCTFPNCGSRLGLDVHHVVPWPDGATEPDNLTCLCRTHHRVVHKHGWHVRLAPDQTTRWFRPDWTPYVPRPPSEVPAEVGAGHESASEEKELIAASATATVQPDRDRSNARIIPKSEVSSFGVTPWWERLGGVF